MSTSLYQIAVPAFRRSLKVLMKLLDQAEERDLADLRLAADMKPFPFQIEAAIDNALGAAARLRGLPAQKVGALATVADMRRALAAALEELDGLDAEDFEGSETREIILPSPKGARHFQGLDYVLSLALPNVQFHTAIAYALLRADGAEIGKRDFLGELPPRQPVTT